MKWNWIYNWGKPFGSFLWPHTKSNVCYNNIILLFRVFLFLASWWKKTKYRRLDGIPTFCFFVRKLQILLVLFHIFWIVIPCITIYSLCFYDLVLRDKINYIAFEVAYFVSAINLNILIKKQKILFFLKLNFIISWQRNSFLFYFV